MRARLLSLLLIFAVCVSLLASFSTTASAAYENTYVNTGNQVADILGVALTQVGYKEGPNNDTKYGDWYGLPNHAWCGMFVAWCADQAGVPTSVLKKYARSNPQGYGLEELSSANYRPKPGDLFFNKSYSHVGFVYYLDGDYFYTLEGNTGSNSDSVCIRRRLISDYTYGSPKYRGGAEHNYTTGHDSAHPHKEYKSCQHCGDLYYTGNTFTAADCLQCKQALCNHKYGDWYKSDSASHAKTCIYCDYTTTENHKWGNDKITTPATCDKNGFKDQTCTVCAAARTVSIPKTEDHDYEEYELLDEETHIRTCKDCAHEDKQPHDGAEQWLCDGRNHWHECSICNDRYDQSTHAFPNGCASTCETCKYTNPDGHETDQPYQFDADGHWYVCKNCEHTYEYGDHSFRAECAEECDICDFTRQTTHDYDSAWHFDANGHWHECNQCGARQDLTSHTPDPKAKDWEDQYCTDCSYLLRSSDEHIHTYDKIYMDETTHWGRCACGVEILPAGHVWSMQTQICTVCNANAAEVTKLASQNHMIYWGLIILGGVLILTVTIIICVKTGKKKQLTTA